MHFLLQIFIFLLNFILKQFLRILNIRWQFILISTFLLLILLFKQFFDLHLLLQFQNISISINRLLKTSIRRFNSSFILRIDIDMRSKIFLLLSPIRFFIRICSTSATPWRLWSFPKQKIRQKLSLKRLINQSLLRMAEITLIKILNNINIFSLKVESNGKLNFRRFIE